MGFRKYVLELDSGRFDYHAATKTFSQERSTLGPNVQLAQQLYDDACDVGFAMRSKRTGKLVHFYESREILSKDRTEIQGWEYKLCPEYTRADPSLRDLKVVVFND